MLGHAGPATRPSHRGLTTSSHRTATVRAVPAPEGSGAPRQTWMETMPRTPTAGRTAVLTRPLAAAALLTALTACSAGGAPEQPGGGGAAAEAGTEKAQI